MNIALASVSAGLTGKSNYFFFGPVLVPRQDGKGSGLVAGFGLRLGPGTKFLLYEQVSTGYCFRDIEGKTDKMFILWPNAIGNDKLLYVDVDKTSVLEPSLQLGAGTDLVTGLLERAADFVVIPVEPSVLQTTVQGNGIYIPILEFNPPAGLD